MASKPTFKRFNENEQQQPGMARDQSNRLLGNRKAFLNNTNQVTNADEKHRDTVMSNSTKDNSDSGIVGPNIEDPHAHLELTEDELNEIYSRPYMNPEHA